MLRSTGIVLLAAASLAALACSSSSSETRAGNGGTGGSGGAADGGDPDSATGGTSSGGTSGGGTSSGGAAGTQSGGTGGSAGATSDGGIDCTESYDVPPTGLAGWSAALSQSGPMTLTYDVSHSHDDQRGPLGFCPASVASGTKYLALVSARFETDQSPPTVGCVADYTQTDPTFAQYGMCFSGGNHNIYVEVRDESGKRAVAGFDVFYGGNVEHITDQGKPANELPMNYAIFADGSYGVRAVYQGLASDAVTNMRMPIHHHVNYLLTFQVKQK